MLPPHHALRNRQFLYPVELRFHESKHGMTIMHSSTHMLTCKHTTCLKTILKHFMCNTVTKPQDTVVTEISSQQQSIDYYTIIICVLSLRGPLHLPFDTAEELCKLALLCSFTLFFCEAGGPFLRKAAFSGRWAVI